ncbi:hypothetical protein CDN99_10570 [Roseateles aquatilis]|uniref:Uncharacterized protein n=1 Tax=Roseateles aquatilis TaxID=431061 RepID=A0A246JG78_9BURK|nr:hypothetical protein [Roseateles aquatilis]OWQ91573.1 hypothetical protein CDN99_10570 [Roseateles aquatilis]
MKRTLIGLALSALVSFFFLWLITRGFGQLMDLLRDVTHPGKGGSAVPLVVIGLAVFVPLLIYRIRKARRKNRWGGDHRA